MRLLPLFLIASCWALLPIAAHSQPSGRSPGGPRERPLTHADSLRTLAGVVQLWTHVGAGWLSAPARVRERYQAGLDLGVSGDRRFADRLALRARLDYGDLPSTQPESILLNGVAFSVSADYGHGWLGLGMAGTALRTWKHLWLEGAAGVGYFRNGYSSGDTFQDLATGRDIPLEATSGWGPAWAAGMRYEFQPSRRDRMLGEVQFASMARDGTPLRFFAVRFGYRAY
ncbi:MAG: hypothetical protein ABIS67_08925 [Candidatus Eisenbacteria bacterium]